MKFFKTKFLGLALVGLILGACSQMATYENADLMNEQAAANKAGFTMTPFGIGNENARAFGADCEAECLTKGTAYTFTENYSTTASAGGNSKLVKATLTVSINTSNVATYTLDMSSERTAGTTNSNVSFTGNLNGVAFNSGSLGGISTKRSYSTTITNVDYTGVACGDEISFSLTEVSFGDDKTLSDTNVLLAYCPEGCEDEMTADLTCGATNTVVFTFYAEEAGPVVIQGGLNAKATYISGSSNVLTQNTTHSSLDNSNASVTRWEGNVAACTAVTVTIEWSGNAEVGDWTAKRGNVTLAEILGSSVTCD
jgi:hypothetical protein